VFYKVSEYRVLYPQILKSIRVSVSDTSVEVSEDQVSDTEKSIGCPALLKGCLRSLDQLVVCTLGMLNFEVHTHPPQYLRG
jgi:hypothetical protein